ncbi:H-NS family nucleoid-associated regulatory protein [Roseateles saccharophilus]|uniref:DNA-binding protein H-NS n=1 Tax=Roseateles saccharophilus TaxID=304 RepID=A0A4R3U9P3_ROSSA|nr:H-NS histone family protein [Roseateles saccharophilus]MDG0835840.1 H-NS histone family protein [Roseateles saccharophilus]TCU83426.1 DNA-binding protein H-NS [Roseateles saccharophilus]
MATKLQTLLKQISKLQSQADSLRSQEKVGVIARIREAIAHYDITSDELFGEVKAKRARSATKPAAAAKKTRKAAKAASVAKYGDGAGRVWSGIGKRPNWFKDALAAGKTAEDLLIAK